MSENLKIAGLVVAAILVGLLVWDTVLGETDETRKNRERIERISPD